MTRLPKSLATGILIGMVIGLLGLITYSAGFGVVLLLIGVFAFIALLIWCLYSIFD